MTQRNKRTALSLLFSLLINALVLFFLLGGVVGVVYQNHKADVAAESHALPTPKVVNAVAYDQQAVDAQVQRIKAQRAAAHKAEVDWKNQLEAEANAAKKARETALAQAKSVAKETAAQKEKAQATLSRLAALQANMQQQLAALEAKQQTLAVQNAAVENHLQATQQALKQSLTQAEKARLETQLLEEKAHHRALAQQKFDNEIARFKTLIQNTIERQWLLPDNIQAGQSCELEITLDPYGRVQSVQIIRASGNALLDRSAITAVLKASPLPVPQSPLLLPQFHTLQLTLKPEGLVSDAT